MTTIQLAWKQARAARSPRRRRTPLLVALVAYLARILPTWKRARTTVMQWTAFGALTFGMFQWSIIAGFVAAGVSLLFLEFLGGAEQ
jgi:hypothetical protein